MSIALMLKVVESLSNGIASCVDVSEIADGAVLFGTKFGCHIHHQIDEKSSNSSCPSFLFSAFCLFLLLVVVFFSCCPTCSFQSHSNFNPVRTNKQQNATASSLEAVLALLAQSPRLCPQRQRRLTLWRQTSTPPPEPAQCAHVGER